MLMQIGGFLTAGFLLAVAFIQWTHPALSISPARRNISGAITSSDVGVAPAFEIQASGLEIKPGSSSVDGTLKGKKGQLTAHVLSADNKLTNLTPSLASGPDGSLTANIPSTHAFRPGKYRVVVESTKGTKTQQTQQDFVWGVLAVNLDKSSYRIGETANLGMAVLDDNGVTICNAKIDVIISDSRGRSVSLSTSNGSIKTSSTCKDKNITNLPDYAATYKVENSGAYRVSITATIKNGVRKTNLEFSGTNSAEFISERHDTATRIYPANPYTVHLSVQANKNFKGSLHEDIPAVFTVSGVKVSVRRDGKIFDPKAKISTADNGDATTHIASGLELIKGDIVDFSYSYKAPFISPQFYQLGPAKLVDTKNATAFQEPRTWQIASDSAGGLIMLWDPANGAIPTGWTCLSCIAGDPFFQRFPRIANTYNTQAGGAETTSHTYTVSSSSANSTTVAFSVPATAPITVAGDGHTHSYGGPYSSSVDNTVPTYVNYKVIQSNAAASTILSLPLNIIAVYDVANASLPSGWTHITAMDGNYVRGENAACASACGAATHTHVRPSGSGNITSGAAIGTHTSDSLLNTGASTLSTSTHTIVSSRGTTDAAPNTPAYAKLNFAINTVNNSAVPSGMMAFFDTASLPVGWTNAISTNASYDNKLIIGSTDPTTSQFGGADTHCHTDGSAAACQETFTTGAPSTIQNNTATTGTVASSTHTHNVIFNVSSDNSVPNYTTLYLAKIRTITVAGTVFSDEGVTALGTQTMRLAIAGGAASRDFVTAANGTYSQYVPDPGPGGVYTLWINSNGGNTGTTVARSGGSNIAGLDVYQNRLMLRHYDAGPITNADIGMCDKLSGAVCVDTDQHYSVTAGNLTVDSDTRVLIGANSTFTPGGSVTLTPGATSAAVGGDLKFAASTAAISMGTNALNIGGDWVNTAAGTFTTLSGQTTTFTGATPGFTIDNGNTQGFQNLTFAGNAGTAGSWSFSPATNNVLAAGDFTISSATTGTNTVTAPSSTLTLGGSFTNNGAFTNNSGTVLFNSTTTGKTIGGSLTGANAFNILTFNGIGGAWSFGSNSADVNASFTITNGTVTAPSTTLTLKNNYSNAGTFTHNSGTVAFSSAVGGNTLGGTMTGASKFNNLSYTSTGSGAWSFGVNNGETAGNFTINSGAVTAPSGTLTIANNYANSGTFNHNSGTITFTATTTGKTINGTLSGTSAFNNLTFNGLGGDWTPNATVGVSGNLTVTAGSLLGTQSINVSGGNTSGNGTINLSGGTFTLTGTGNFGGTSPWTFSTLVFGTGVVNTTTAQAAGGGNITAATETIGVNQVLNAGSHNWILTANSTPFVINGTFTPQTSTITYQPVATTGVNVTATGYHHVVFNKIANIFVLTGAVSTDTANGGGNLTITAGTLDVTASNFAISDGGNWTNSDTFNSRAGLVTFSAIGTGHTLSGAMTGANKFYTLTFNGSGGAWSFGANAADVADNFTITLGTVTAPSTTLSLNNNYTNNGTFTHNSGTVLFNAATSGKTLSGSLAGTSKFNNLTFASSGTGDWSINAAGETASNFTIGNATSTVTLPATTLTVGANFANSGTFIHNSGTVVFGATTSGKTINNGASSFNNLTFNGTGGVWSPLTNTLRAVGDLLMTAGTLDNSSGSADVIVNGNATGSAGVIALTGSGVTFTQRVASAKQFGTSSGSVAWSFTNLSISNSSGTAAVITAQAGTGSETISGVLTLGAGGDTGATTLDAGTGGRIWTLSGTTGVPFVLNAGSGLLGDVSTFSYTGNNAAGDTTLAPTSYNILTIGGAAAENYNPSGVVSTTGDLLVNTNATLIGTQIITIGGQFYGAGTVTLTGGKLSMRSSTNTTFGTTSSTNNWTFNDLSFENGSGTAPTTGKTINGTLSGTSAFNNLTFNGLGGDWTPNATVGVSGNLTVTAGSLLGTQSINVSGGNTSGNGTINLSGGTFTLTGTGNFGGTSPWTFSTLVFGTGVVNTTTAQAAGGGNITAATETIGVNQVLNAGSHNWILTANSTPFVINGTFTPQTSTITYQPVATTGVNVTATGYHHVVFNKIANIFVLTGAVSTDTANGGGNLTITAGTLDVTASNFAISDGGNWTNSDTFNSRAGLVTFSAIGTGHTLSGAMTGANKFYTLTFNGSGGAWSFGANAADVADNFTITLGTVTAPSTTLSLNNNYTNNGTFTHNSGTVLFNAATSGKTLSGSLAGTSKFNNLTFASSGTGDWSINAAGETASNFTIGNATSTVTLPATTLTVGANFANSGTFIHNSGTVVFGATTSGKTINNGASSFNNLTFNGTGGVWSPLTNTLRAVGDLLMTAGTLDNSSGSADVIVNGNATGSAGVIALTGSGVTFTQRVASAKQFGTSSGSVAWSFTNLSISNSSGTAAVITAQAGTGSETISGVLTLGAGGDTGATTLDAGTGGRIWTLSGTTGVPFVLNAGSGLLGDVSTFSYTGNNAAGDTTLAPTSYNILTIGGAAAENYNPSGVVSTTGDLLVNTNATLIGTQIITIGGQFYGAGTVTLTGGKLSMRSSTNTTFGTTSSTNNWTFNDLSFENGSGTAPTTYTWNAGGTGQIIVNGTTLIGKATDTQIAIVDDATNNRVIVANGDVAIATKGELRAPTSASFTVKGSWSNLGLFTSGAGTVSFISATTGKTLSGNLNSTSSFNKIIFNNAAGGWAINNDLRSASDFTLTAITTGTPVGLIVPANVIIEVDGIYSFAQNAAPDGTSWDPASTLSLNPASTLTYTIGSRTQTTETYGKITVGSNANIRTWNSGEAGLITVNIGTSGSLYSQNDGNISGVLKVYGNYHTGLGQTNDCWQYAKDFDCTTTVSRQVLVSIETGAGRGVTVDSGKSLTILGGGGGVNQFTNVDRIGATGTYLLANNSGSALTPTDGKIANAQFAAGVWNALNVVFSGTTPYVLATAAAGTTLTPDWYFSTRIQDRSTSAAVQTAGADITVTEASSNATVFKEATGAWSGAASQTATSDASGNIPQPQADGALRLREYSQSSNGTATATSYYRYNVNVAKQTAYADYDFFRDWGGNYITSTANTGAGLNAVMGTSWFRDIDGTKNTESAQNVAPTSGSSVIGDSKAIILLWDPANGAVPSGWTSVSESGGPLNQMFIKGAALYGNSCTASCPESVSHSFKTPHGVIENDPTGTVSAGSLATAIAAATHTHSYAATFGSTASDIKPQYFSLQFIRGPAAGDNTGKWPVNVITMFDSSGLPTGWTSYDNLNNDTNLSCNCQRYLRGDASGAIARGGASFHTHTISAGSVAAAAATGTVAAATTGIGTQVSATTATHTHSAPSANTTFGGGAGDTSNNLPPFVNIKYAKLSSSAAAPDQALGMFDYPTQTQTGLTLASSWSIVSGASTIYNGNLLRGALTPGSTGGSATHTHGGTATLTSGTGTAIAADACTVTCVVGSKSDHTHSVIYDVDTASGNNSVPNNADLVIGKFTASGNTTPASPTTLAQVKVTGGTTLATGGWVNETQLKFTGLVADSNASDSDQLCVEIKPISTAFSFVETACGSLVSYAGTAVAANVTITGISDQTQYHWQASTRDAAGLTSGWVSYGGNLDTIPADRDFGIDTTAPVPGTIYDNFNTGSQPSLTDTDQNGDGSLTTLSASWGGFDNSVSGLNKYEYSIGSSPGAIDKKGWTDATTATSFRAAGLALTTGEIYFVNVRATDNAGNVSAITSSDGQVVTTLLSLSISSSTVTFNNLTSTTPYDSKTTDISVSTNATSGYSVKSQRLSFLTIIGGTITISDFSAGSYSAPAAWPDPCSGSSCGFGYTSNDTRVGNNLFATGSLFAPFASTGPGDIVMKSTSNTPLDGTGVATSETRTITNKVSVSAAQAAGSYQTNVMYTVIPVY